VAGSGTALIDLEADSGRWARQAADNLSRSETGVEPDHLAYVIYTSGSTGQPKGVMVAHRGVGNLAQAQIAGFEIEADSRVLQFASFSFDACVSEIVTTLVQGATLVLPASDMVLAGPVLVEMLAQERITHVTLPPVVLAGLPEEAQLETVRTLVMAGEASNAALVRRFGRNRRLLNAYGPTEYTVCATMQVCDLQSEQAPAIGRPIANTRIYLLDVHGQPVPQGVVGEIHIGGVQVARGYLNRDELTAERFVADPFSNEPDARMYRTGDLGRYLPDGSIAFLGRNDQQVKLRGFRIELGEIEAALLEQDGIREAVVLAREDRPGDKRLVAYLTTDAQLDTEALRVSLQATLPEYMVPAAYVQLDTLPLTPNGKLDRQALPAPEGDAYASHAYEAPVGEVETALAAIWAEVLGVEQVGRHDNFFTLGGHSLLAVKVASRVRQVLGVELGVTELFAHASLSLLATAVGQAAQSELPAITLASRADALPLSFAQQRLWFLSQMEGVSQAYHIPIGLRLSGWLDRRALYRALDRIQARHEALRSTFVLEDGKPVQRISPEDKAFELRELDLRTHPDREAALEDLARQEAKAPFDLQAGPLVRACLIALADNEHALLVTMHHIVSDGVSKSILVHELSALYSAYIRMEDDPLAPLAIQYADFAVWQRHWLNAERLQAQCEFWKRTLAGAPAVLELPSDRPRPPVQDYAGDHVDLVFDKDLTIALQAMGERYGTTLYMTLLAAWSTLLARLSGQDDIVVGTPVANRNAPEVERLIGFFVNTLALRLDMSGTPTAGGMLQRVKARVLEAQAHQDLPFEQLVELVNPVRSMAHTPVFQSMFAWQADEDASLALPGLELTPLAAVSGVAQFDLSLHLCLKDGKVTGEIEYATALFDRITIERFATCLRTLARAFASDGAASISRLPLLDEAERADLFAQWNAVETLAQQDVCVHAVFEERAAAAPESTALMHDGNALSYGELNERANRLARHLRKLGVAPDTRIGICADRSPETLVGMLAILKAGAAYVPLDAAYPAARLARILDDCEPLALLAAGSAGELIAALNVGAQCIDLAGDAHRWADEEADNLPPLAAPHHLAYVIYTSGSTGEPKGVMVEHRSVASQVQALARRYRISKSDQVLQFASISFDASVEEIFCTLLSGATLVLRSDAWLASAQVFWQLCAANRISVADLPTRFWQQLASDTAAVIPPCMRAVIIGGEAVERSALRQWFLRDGQRPVLFNTYGPTETTVVVTVDEIVDGKGSHRSIGRPIANTRIYLLDEQGAPVPPGVPGEIYIGGPGLARGYLNRSELSAQRFVPDPCLDDPDARLYRTGDIGRFAVDGSLEFLGRRDSQVKIRGFRVEPEEVQAVLAQHPGVAAAAVCVFEDANAGKRLVAFFTGNSDVAGPDALRAFLASRLPEYMVPAAYVALDSLPLTPSGKLDVRALPVPGESAYAIRVYEAPVGAVETAVAQVWSEVLKQEQVGRQDDFFMLGGHSLLGVTMCARLQQMLGVDVGIADLFNYPVLKVFAQAVGRAEHTTLPPVIAVERNGPLALSFSQQRLWLLAQMGEADLTLHMPAGLRLKGRLDLRALQRALDRLIDRHEVLRTTFDLADGVPMQHIGDAGLGFALQEQDLSDRNDAHAELQHLVVDEASTRFDLQAGPLARGRLIRMGPEEHVLLITMHHIVSDAWSLEVLVRELGILYRAFTHDREDPLAPLAVQYADYAAWQRCGLAGDAMAIQAEYWQRTLAGAPARIELPCDYPRPALMDPRGGMAGLNLDAGLVGELKAFSQRNGTTLFVTLLAAWAVVLGRLSGQQELVIGTPVANRSRVELEPLIGFFLNNLALRVDLSGQPAVGELLQRVKKQALEAQQH
ncbi:amino acid adenylation domain-containing protein, partial [Herbaspirillum sp. GCM10030257]|uniref:amino acid adenylation domain-containing protein n=1 Tax=Herbaspirillum sp. GCM10030257 TaxID=3273393 RepID=UPI0036228E03